MVHSNPRVTNRVRPRTTRPRLTSTTRSRSSLPSSPRTRPTTPAPSRLRLGLRDNAIARSYYTLIELMETTKSIATNPTLWKSLLRCSIFLVVAVYLYAAAWGIYVTFYANYIPTMNNHSPLYFNYGKGGPHTTVPAFVNNKPKFFGYGQSYDLFIELEVPESENNYEQGNFMVRLELNNKKGRSILVSERPGLLKYRSTLLRKFITVFYGLPLVLGMKYEKQQLNILLVEKFWENYDEATHTIKVQLSNPKLQIYSAKLVIQAHLHGLKYFMYHWPTLTSHLITSLFFFGELIFALLAWQGIVYLWNQRESSSPPNSNFPSPIPPPVASNTITENPSTSSDFVFRPISPPTTQHTTTEEEEWERLSATYLSGGALTPPMVRPAGTSVQATASRESGRVAPVTSSSHDPDANSYNSQYFGQLVEDPSTEEEKEGGENGPTATSSHSLDMDLLTFMAHTRSPAAHRPTTTTTTASLDPDQRSGTLVELTDETSGLVAHPITTAKPDPNSPTSSSSYRPNPNPQARSRLRKSSLHSSSDDDDDDDR